MESWSNLGGAGVRSALLACVALVTVSVFEACGSDADSRPVDAPDSGQQDVSAEAPETGGTGGTGGASGTGGAAGTDSGDCLAGALTVDPALFPVCTLCAGAHCVPATAVDATQAAQLADCADGSKCVPDPFIASGGKFVVASCRSLLGAEGRCLSPCLPAIQAQADRLPQDSCDEGEVCAPCYDPTNGTDTSACKISCDPGPQEPAKVFDKCCSDLGLCVPTSLVPTDQASLLGADTCAADMLCAPATLIDPSAVPASCRSVGDSEGRCIPDCLPAIQGVKNLLPQDSCATGMLCAPCFDPRTGEPTGSCTINGDSPTEDPYVFPKCCAVDGGSTLGTCVPAAAVPGIFASSLSQDTCPDSTMVCAPDIKVADLDAKFPSCLSAACIDGSCYPGACVPVCIVPEQYRGLPQTTCAEGELCAPCENPIADGASTGACD